VWGGRGEMKVVSIEARGHPDAGWLAATQLSNSCPKIWAQLLLPLTLGAETTEAAESGPPSRL